MVEIELKSNEIKEDIYLKLNKDRNTPIYDTDLDKIEHLNLNSLDFLDEPTDISLYDLVFFKNLKSCCIIDKVISENETELLSKLKSIETIQFTRCVFPDNMDVNLCVEYLILDKCPNIKIARFKGIKTLKQLRIVNCDNIDIDGISSLENVTGLYLQSLYLDNIDEIENMNKLQYLNLNGTKIKKEITKIGNNDRLKIVHEEMNFMYDE